jgi:hypothetical protein
MNAVAAFNLFEFGILMPMKLEVGSWKLEVEADLKNSQISHHRSVSRPRGWFSYVVTRV